MIRAGDSIENPVTGERIVFRKTSAETNGEAVVIECFVKPNGAVAKAHVHPSQDERFEVLKGSLMLKLDGQELPASVFSVEDGEHLPALHSSYIRPRGRMERAVAAG